MLSCAKLCVRFTLPLASCVIVLACVGCHAAPSAMRGDDIDSLAERRQLAAEYWERLNLPADFKLDQSRAVISEFVVEFVTEKRESVGLITKQQSIVNVPAGYIGAGIEVSGINRKVIEFGDALPQSLPDALYDSFASLLRQRGCRLVDPQRVLSAAAYAKLAGAESEDTSFLQRLNPIASDTGRVLKAVYRPAKGLKVLEGGDLSKLEEAELALLEELQADLSIRARFRVGVFDHRVSLDRGALVNFTSSSLAGSVTSLRSLLSDKQIIDSRDFFPLKGDVLIVNPDEYRAALLELFPHFVAMGFDSPAH